MHINVSGSYVASVVASVIAAKKKRHNLARVITRRRCSVIAHCSLLYGNGGIIGGGRTEELRATCKDCEQHKCMMCSRTLCDPYVDHRTHCTFVRSFVRFRVSSFVRNETYVRCCDSDNNSHANDDDVAGIPGVCSEECAEEALKEDRKMRRKSRY